LDIEQVVIRERLILTALISLNPDHAEAIEADLNECAEKLSVDIATSFGSQEGATIAAKSGLVHVVILTTELHPRSIAAVAEAISEQQGNIENVLRPVVFTVFTHM
jgi:phosphoserine phosphatase